MGKQVVETIYLEHWVIKLIRKDLHKLCKAYKLEKIIKVWPVMESIT
jgi:NAD kinase